MPGEPTTRFGTTAHRSPVEGKRTDVKKLTTLGLIVSIVVGLVALDATAADARRRHNRNHRRNVHCGPGTHREGNKCVANTQGTTPGPNPVKPFPTGTAFGCPAGNYSLQPCIITLTRTSTTTGSFSGTFTASGLPPSTSVTVTPFAGAACPMTGGGSGTTGSGFGGGGSVSFGLANAGTCQAGSYPINIFVTANPGQFFTAFVQAQLF